MAKNLFFEDEEILGMPPMSSAPAPDPLAGPMPLSSEDPNYAAKLDTVKQGLREKYGLAPSMARQELVDAVSKAKSPALSALAGFGASLQGKSASDAIDSATKRQTADASKALSEFDKAREDTMKDFTFDRSISKAEQEDQSLADKKDPNSDKSKAYQALLIEDYDMDPAVAAKMSAEQVEARIPSLKAKAERKMREFDMSERREDRKLNREVQLSQLASKEAEKRETKARPSDKQIEAFTDLDSATSDLNNLMGSLGNNDNWVGPIDGALSDRLVGDDQVAFRSAVGKYNDAYRKAITGAGASEKEMSTLASRLPSIYDSPGAFKKKAAEALKELERKKAVLASNLTKGGKDVSKFVAPPSESPQASSKVRVSNGKETLMIDPSDLGDAEADGYKRVQ